MESGEHEVLLNALPVPAVLIELETAAIRFSNAAADLFAGGEFPKELSHELFKTAARGERLSSRETYLSLNGRSIPVVISSGRLRDSVVVTIQDARPVESAKHRFLRNISHEVRTPLNAIVGFSELLTEKAGKSSANTRYIQAIRRNGEALSRVVADILEISVLDERTPRIENERISPKREAESVAAEFAERARERGIGLQARFAGEEKWISADPRRLRQVLTNLLDNAVKFTPKGFIQIEGSLSGERLEFRVTDTGEGIADCYQAGLFSPFYQADGSPTRRHGGSGLGLDISRKLARAMGGDVVLERSRPGQGSRFLFWIPAVPAEEPSRPVPAISERRKLEGARILVVEDAPDNRVLVGKFLALAGAKVEFAVNGLEGVEKALKKPFDIILMDIQMPELDGYEATAHLRWKKYTGPIVALTAHSLREEREKCFEAGCDEHLMKPVDRALLIDTLSRFLNRDEQTRLQS